MSFSENPDSSQNSEEKIPDRRSSESEISTNMDFILDDGKSTDALPIHKPYIPAMENNEPPVQTSDSDGKWDRPPAPRADAGTPEVQPPPVPQQTTQPETKPATQHYIPGMPDTAQLEAEAQAKKTSKKSSSSLPFVKMALVLLILAGGGYLGYHKFWKSEGKAEDAKPAQPAKQGDGQLLITKLNQTAEKTPVLPVRPKPTAAQVQQAQANLMGFIDRAKAVVAKQNARLQETVENVNRQKANGARRKSGKSGQALATDGEPAAGDETAKADGEEADSTLTYGPAPEGFKLTGTMNLNGNRRAFINNTVVTVGKVINEATVVKIGHRWVELKQDNLLFRLNMD